MYKKITCAFCLVISIFILAVVVYLLWTETDLFSHKPLELEVPRISIYLVNASTREENRLHTSRVNSDFILDFESERLEDVDDALGNILRIQCHSNYPVQLKYIGFGNLTDARNENRRQITDFEQRSTYKFFAQLEFRTVDEAITGKYDCQVRDEAGSLIASTSVYVYAPGEHTFVSHSTRELVVEPGSPIQVPCPITHPDKATSVILLSLIQPIQTIVEKEVEPERIRGHDPKLGFILNPNSWGSFVCKDEATSELSGRVTVFRPLSNVLKGRSLRISSQNVDTKADTLKLACRAIEPVELRFINFVKFSRPVRETKNDTLDFPYAARIKLNTEWFRGNTAMVECVTKRDGRLIKTWKFLNTSEEASLESSPQDPQVRLQLTKDRHYQCCSDRKDMRPILTSYPCRTPTECELRVPCLSFKTPRNRTTLNCPLFEFANEAIYEGTDNGCTLLKTDEDHRSGSGLIRCSLDSDVRDYAYFIGKEMDGAYSSISNLDTSKRKLEARSVLRLTQKGFRSRQVVKGVPVRFGCVGSKLHFSSGFQWAVEKVNEPIKYLVNKGEKRESSSSLHEEWIDVPYTDHSPKRVYCFAPLINSPQWLNISVSFRYDLFW